MPRFMVTDCCSLELGFSSAPPGGMQACVVVPELNTGLQEGLTSMEWSLSSKRAREEDPRSSSDCGVSREVP